MLFPKLSNDEWLIKEGIFAFMRNQRWVILNRHHKKKSQKLEINIPKTLYFILNHIEVS